MLILGNNERRSKMKEYLVCKKQEIDPNTGMLKGKSTPGSAMHSSVSSARMRHAPVISTNDVMKRKSFVKDRYAKSPMAIGAMGNISFESLRIAPASKLVKI